MTPRSFILPFIVIFVFGCLLTLYWLLFYGLLFYHMQKKHITFYKSIGRPLVLYAIPYFDNFLRVCRGGLLATSWVSKGVPKNFPSDTYCKKASASIDWQKKYFPYLLLLWGITVIVFMVVYAIYQTNHYLPPGVTR